MNRKKLTYAAPLAYRQDLFRITDDNMIYLKKKYKISDSVLQESIRHMKEWYDKQPHFPHIEFEDSVMARCLATNKFSIEKTKTKLSNLFTAKSVIYEFFSIRDPKHPRIEASLKALDWVIFPQLTPDKCRVVFTRLIDSNADNYDPCMMYNVGFMLADMRLATDAVHGDIYIWDFGKATFGHVTKVPPLLMKKCAFIIQNCYSQSVKGIHMLNLPPFAEFLINLLKSTYSKKIANRMHVHRNVEELYKHIPRSIFPSDMGGDEPQTSYELADKFRKVFQSDEWRQWFLDTEQLKSDESRRLPTDKNVIEDTYGLSGSFRKLDFD